MPRLARAQYDARQQIQQLAIRALLPTQLGTLLLQALSRAVPSDIQMLLGVDPASLLFNRLLSLQGVPEESFRVWLEHVYLVREPTYGTTFPGLMQAGLSAIVLRDDKESCWGVPSSLFHPICASELYHAYHDIDAPAGGMLRVLLAADGKYLAALELLRYDARHPFRPGDLVFLRLVAPLIGQALRSAFDREQASASPNLTGPGATGVLVLAPGGHVTLETPAARAWLDLLRATEQLKGGGLPTAVTATLGSLRPRVGELFPHAVLAATPAGFLRVEASLTSEDGSFIVTLAPQQPLTLPEVPASWPLTRQERLVCELLLRGQSNRQIATALVVSENTVETHCTHIYERLQIHSRNELLGLFFQQVYRPSFPFPGKQ